MAFAETAQTRRGYNVSNFEAFARRRYERVNVWSLVSFRSSWKATANTPASLPAEVFPSMPSRAHYSSSGSIAFLGLQLKAAFDTAEHLFVLGQTCARREVCVC